ncbi:uncharacterized protein LOC126783989 [Argentina anserina]|uniref:uncharacterized protein LOC126783989 n=1 Tax=Argentina anserina TaxID=57926 RepID=UPI0021768496|nr:uncharacterized protein LOC126783989 [Potentilla anserina]
MDAFSASCEFLTIPKCLAKVARPQTSPNSCALAVWQPPKQGTFKVNTYASWCKDTSSCGIAALARNDLGVLIAGTYERSYADSSLAAEALALELGLKLASSSHLSQVCLESDSLVLINNILNPTLAVDWSASQILSRIWSHARFFNRINWAWTSRNVNQAADHIVGLAERGVRMDDWIANPPPSLLRILIYDAAGPPW